MDEGQHVGDHLDHRGRAERSHVDDLAAHRLQAGWWRAEQRLVAADEHGDLAGRGPVHAAGDRAPPAWRCRARAARAAKRRISSGPLVLISIQVAPCRHRRQQLRRAPPRVALGEGRQVMTASTAAAPAPPGSPPSAAPAASRRLGARRVEVVDGDGEAGADQARGEVAAEMAEADEAVAHRLTSGRSTMSRCSSVAVIGMGVAPPPRRARRRVRVPSAGSRSRPPSGSVS